MERLEPEAGHKSGKYFIELVGKFFPTFQSGIPVARFGDIKMDVKSYSRDSCMVAVPPGEEGLFHSLKSQNS